MQERRRLSNCGSKINPLGILIMILKKSTQYLPWTPTWLADPQPAGGGAAREAPPRKRRHPHSYRREAGYSACACARAWVCVQLVCVSRRRPATQMRAPTIDTTMPATRACARVYGHGTATRGRGREQVRSTSSHFGPVAHRNRPRNRSS